MPSAMSAASGPCRANVVESASNTNAAARNRNDICILITAVAPPALVQREYKQIARVLQVIELRRVQMPSSGLHGDVLLSVDRVSDRRAFQWRADVEAPQLLERLVVVRDDPTVLKRGEHDAAGRVGPAGSD